MNLEALKLSLKKIYSDILNFYLSTKNLKNDNVIFLISFHRSGSTWIMEILKQVLNAAVIYEPLYVKENFWLQKKFKKDEVITPNFHNSDFLISFFNKIVN